MIHRATRTVNDLFLFFETFSREKTTVISRRLSFFYSQAPDNLRSKPAELVAYLIATCKTELEKYRAIFRWIASHIDYDVEFLNTGECAMMSIASCARSDGNLPMPSPTPNFILQ
jgi:hypothetical protein